MIKSTVVGWERLVQSLQKGEAGRKVKRAKRIAQGASKKKQLPNRPGQFHLKISLGYPSRIEYPDAFYEGRCVVDADHVRHLSVGVVGVNSWARTVDCSLVFRGEGDNAQK